MTHNTFQLLQSFQERTEAILQKAIGQWQNYSPERLAAQAAPEKWSAAQCLEHLNIYGHHYLPAIQKAIKSGVEQGLKPSDNFNPGYLGAYFTKLMLPQSDGQLKSNIKAPKNAIPAEHPDPVASLAEFIDQQEQMLQLLASAQNTNLTKIRVPISLTPWIRLRLGDTFGFVVAHIERHVLQAERAIGNK